MAKKVKQRRKRKATEADVLRWNRQIDQRENVEYLAPGSTVYEVIDAVPIGPHLVMKVQYPNCSMCAYEGIKVMVFLNVNLIDALKWKTIDPHFRASDDPVNLGRPRQAPSPAARFPASEDGWEDALTYAKSRSL